MFRKTPIFDHEKSGQGYRVFPQLVSRRGVDFLKKEIFSIVETADQDWLERNSARTATGDYLVIRSIDTPSSKLFECGRHRTLIRLAESFSHKRVTPLYIEFFNKPPGSNSPSPLHQDHAFYNEHFPDELGVTFWIALDDCDPSNGCMHIKPQYDRTLLPHKHSRALGFAYEMVNQELDGLVQIPLMAGDVLLHGSFTPHYCPPNLSNRSRMAIAISFRTSDYREQMSPWRS